MKKKEKKKLTKLEKWFRFMRRFYKYVARPFLPYKAYGHTDKFNDGPYIFVGNHKSVLDVIPAAMATDKAVHFMSKSELFQKGISKWFTKKCECIPVSRDGTDVRAVMQAMKILKAGGIVCIFPEGTRNKTNKMFLPFKSGAAALAIKTRTPIVPIIQVNKIKFFKNSHFYYGEPFELTEFYDKKLNQEEIEKADEVLVKMLAELYLRLEDILKSNKKRKK
ncbi:MAG: 1-acyl-sn-glycerol-3-phosphate acyltransferase [Clostridia bacterium]|nr:1-acyl-sn-glycerol-3-phosphate acyltransferase [Clostridia bacterium]